MNENRLLALYDRVAELPNAVGRLRRFVLDLAVRGKLVEQNPADEPASALLKRLDAERTRLFNAGAIGKKALHPQMVAAPFDLPRTWCWASLGSVLHYDAGVKRRPGSLDSSLWLLELEDIEKSTGRLLKRLRTSDREPRSTKSEFQRGDILYGKLRPYLNKVIVAREIGYSTTEIVAMRPYRRLSSEYCALALRSPGFVDYVTHAGRGTKMPRLRTEDAVIAPFPLPPLAEQQRIVSKAEDLMEICDLLEETREAREETRDQFTNSSYIRLAAPHTDARTFRTHARLTVNALPALTDRLSQVERLRQTILGLAVHGHLVEQNPTDEPASELLRRISREKGRLVRAGTIRQRKLKSRPRRKTVDFSTPPGWELTDLGSTALKITDGAHRTPTYVSSGVPFVSVKDFSAGRLDLGNTRFIPQSEHEVLYRRCDPRRGDLLLARIGTLGRAVVVDTDAEFSLFVSVALIRFDRTNVEPLFAQIVLNSPLALQEFNRIKIGGSTHTNKLNLGDLHTVSFPLPPLVEQRRIVAKANQLMNLCDRLEAGLASTDRARGRLLESLIHAELHS